MTNRTIAKALNLHILKQLIVGTKMMTMKICYALSLSGLIFFATAVFAEDSLVPQSEPQQAEEYAYVNDVIYINLRSGPGPQDPTLSVIPSGTRLQMLERDVDKGISRVRLDTGEEGWVLNRFLREDPIARDRLAAAQASIATLTGQNKTLSQSLAQVHDERGAIDKQLSTLKRKNKRLAGELKELRAISAGAVAAQRQKRVLQQQMDEQKSRLYTLENEHSALQNRVYLTGVSAAIVSLVIGFYIGYTPVRRQKQWRRLS